MAITDVYANFDLATGSDTGADATNAYKTWASMIAGVAPGDRVNIKKTASAYTPGATLTFAVSSTDLLPIILRGYGSTIDDDVKFVIDMTTFSFNITAQGILTESFDVTGTTTGAVVNQSGDASCITLSSIVNTGTGVTGTALQLTDGQASNLYLETNATGGNGSVYLQRGSVRNSTLVSTYIGITVIAGFKAQALEGLLVYAKGASAIRGIYIDTIASVAGLAVSSTTIEGFTDLIYIGAGGSYTAAWWGNFTDLILVNATTGIKNVDAATLNIGVWFETICFYNCTTDMDFGDNPIINKISLSGDPFNDVAGLDYSLNDTAGAGADCRGAVRRGGVA